MHSWCMHIFALSLNNFMSIDKQYNTGRYKRLGTNISRCFIVSGECAILTLFYHLPPKPIASETIYLSL